MKKSYFIFLVGFMILCVTGIILVQWYFINTTIQNRDQEFSLAVKQSLNSVSNDIQENELRHYIQTFEKLKDSIGKPDTTQLRNFFLFYDSEDESNLSSLFTFGLVEEKFNIAILTKKVVKLKFPVSMILRVLKLQEFLNKLLIEKIKANFNAIFKKLKE